MLGLAVAQAALGLADTLYGFKVASPRAFVRVACEDSMGYELRPVEPPVRHRLKCAHCGTIQGQGGTNCVNCAAPLSRAVEVPGG